ncbi:hypothetical protein ACOI9Y_37655, partial [Mesorhizobium japonicum]
THATQNYLQKNFEPLKSRMRSEPAPHFREASSAPTYTALQAAPGTQHNGFSVSRKDVFLEAKRDQHHCAGAYAGDKFHISVQP